MESSFGDHLLVIYDNLNAFRRLYVESARRHLTLENTLMLIVPHYETPKHVIEVLKKEGVDAERYLRDGSLTIIDSVMGYQTVDVEGVYKLVLSLLARGKREGKIGLCGIADMGSFMLFRRKSELVEYESRFSPFLEFPVKVYCCYHKKDFASLKDYQQQVLLSHHKDVIFT